METSTSYSVTQGGNLLVVAGALALLLKKVAGVDFAADEIALVLTAIGVCVSWYGRYRRGDVTATGFKRW